MVKQRNESCEVYQKAGRKELLESEKKEITVINVFAKQLSEGETKKFVSKPLNLLVHHQLKIWAKSWEFLKSKYADTLDFSKVSTIFERPFKFKMKYPKEYLMK